jgi:ATP-independent RNA helicase DbpA
MDEQVVKKCFYDLKLSIEEFYSKNAQADTEGLIDLRSVLRGCAKLEYALNSQYKNLLIMEQEDREKALLKFRNGSYRLLITTDLASRGLDIPEIDHVIHYQMPHNEEAFLHRNGRTARMHSSGTAYVILTEAEQPSFLSDNLEVENLPEKDVIPPNTEWATLYLGAGRKDKINKIDIVGLLLKKGKLDKDELGLIEVQDFSSYAAVKRNKIDAVVRLLKMEKIKNKKIKIEVSR